MPLIQTVEKMASRGTDQFYFILTSDGSMDIYPDNKSSAFRIALKNPIDVGEEQWEVCLLSINYPYSWTNVGPSAKVFMKYYVDGEKGVQYVHFPNWQCHSMEEVVKFLGKKFERDHNRDGDKKVWVSLDELGRFKIASNSSTFDVGFSDNMLRLLGLAGHEKVEYMTIKSFDERQSMRDIFTDFWRADRSFDLGDFRIRKQVENAETLWDFIAVIHPYIDMKKLEVRDFEHEAFSEGLHVEVEAKNLEYEPLTNGVYLTGTEKVGSFWDSYLKGVPLDDTELLKTKGGKLMSLFQGLMKKFYEKSKLGTTIRGVTPGLINPVQRMYVYTNIMEAIDMNDDSVKLLKLVNTRGEPFKTTQEDFNNPTYFPLLKGRHSMISVLIMDESGAPVSFQSGTVVLTLHFRRSNYSWRS